jgi:hypothetical protein
MIQVLTSFPKTTWVWKRPRIFLLFILIIFPALISAAETSEIPVSDYSLLLAGFIERDAQGQQLALKTGEAALALEKYSVETGICFTVSSGKTTLAFAPSGLAISSVPGLEINFPRLRNSSLSVNVPLQSGGSAPESYGMDTTLKVGIIPGREDTYNEGLERKKRELVIALREQEKRLLIREKEFCEAIKDLLTARDTMLEAHSQALLARIDVEQKRQGYDSSSVALRTAELKLRSREREVMEADRALQTALKTFADHCGVEHAEIPENIPDDALLDIASFDPSLLSDLENARWDYTMNNMDRQAASRPFSLAGWAGYKWSRTTASSGSTLPGGDFTSSAKAGLDFGARGGLTASAGVEIPLEKPNEPALNLSFSWKLSSAAVSRIDGRLRDISERRELIAISEAERKFLDQSAEYSRKKADLEWQKEVYNEEAELFRVNSAEQKVWYDRGIIRESDYLNAQNDHHRSENRILSARIDRRLYNLEIETLFVPSHGAEQ